MPHLLKHFKRLKHFSTRRVVHASMITVGVVLLFGVAAYEDSVAHGALIGGFGLLMMLVGLFDALGLTSPEHRTRSWRQSALGAFADEPRWAQPTFGVVASLVVLLLGVALGGYAMLSWTVLAALLPLVPAALRRPGLAVFLITVALYIPWLGSFSLWDPWETHYGEVAREILARNDWISLWWSQEGWFWSKPILIFWTEALSMSALGVDPSPDAHARTIEWAIRLPVALFSVAAVMTVYATVRRFFSARTGAVTALVLATTPHFFFLSHQAITDMFLVANVTIALCLLMLAVNEDPTREAQAWRIGGNTDTTTTKTTKTTKTTANPWHIHVSLQHLILGLIALIAVPQIIYLVSRNLVWNSQGFLLQIDHFWSGSAGNAGNPGNVVAAQKFPVYAVFQPAFQALVYTLGLVGIFAVLRKERRVQALLMAGFYVFCGLAFMGKSLPGLAIPGLVALCYLITARRWDLLIQGRLHVTLGLLIVAVVSFPWYIAMFVRHGVRFTNRLLIHDHINRLTTGVHMDESSPGSVGYYIEQLGTGLFPWVGLVPAALLAYLWAYPARSPCSNDTEHNKLNKLNKQRNMLLFLSLWFFTGFVLFSAMSTKFHHYIFPTVPAAAIAAGILFDRFLGPSASASASTAATPSPNPSNKANPCVRAMPWLFASLASLAIVLGIAGLWGDVRGVLPAMPASNTANTATDWVLTHPWNLSLCIALVLLGLFCFMLAYRKQKPISQTHTASDPTHAHRAHDTSALGMVAVIGALGLAWVGRDLSWVTSARPFGYERLIHLFVYNYRRAWPAHLDYRAILTGFAVVATAWLAIMGVARLRAVATRALLGLAIMFTAWSLHFYIPDLAEHWGQRLVIAHYYELRESPEEHLIAWQLNWKGENFYTGNRVYAFRDLDNKKLNAWLANNKGTTVFFVLQRARLPRLRSTLRASHIRSLTERSTVRESNKFLLVEVEL